MFAMPLRASRSRSHPFVALAVAAVVVAAGTLAPAPRASATPQRNPEDLLIVDCLLPGQVRRLGSHASFMSARRPIRTTQADCEIRGGEYVSYDRANYRTALEVWRGQAEGGDPAAQNYVGEIYLKGLGTEPDYARAAQWFEKAAAQGSRRARINLGYMYEQGLGVPQDVAKALNLYREASGITGDKLVFASAVTAQVEQARAEAQSAREQLSSEQQRSERLQQQVEQLKAELQRKRSSYEKSQRQLNDVRKRLDAEQKKLGVENDPGYGRLKTQLEARERTLRAEEGKLEQARQANAKRQADAEAEIARLKAREKQLAGTGSNRSAELSALREDAARSERTLALARQQLLDLQQDLDKNEQQLQEARAKFDGARMQLAQEHAQNRESTRLLRLMEAEMREKRQELSTEHSQLLALRAKINARPATDASPTPYSTASVGGGLRVEILEPALTVTRGSSQPAASLMPAQKGMDIVGRVVAPSGLTSLQINGQTISADAAGGFKTHVDVGGGSTPVRVAAVDKGGHKATLDFVLLPPPEDSSSGALRAQIIDTLPRGVRLGTYHAIVIGNDAYQAYPALKGAVADATAVAKLLKTRYGYDTHLLTNANRFEILSALNDMREELGDRDNLLIYYAGHGEVDATRQGYWLPTDARLDQPNSWISNRAISDILTTMNAKHVLVIADSCYSGTMTRTALATFGGGMTGDSWPDWVKTMVDGRSRTALTSGGVQPVADASRDGHSQFASALLVALRDNNQLLTGQRLYREVAASMALTSSGAGLQQVPEYAPIQFAGHEAGEFFLMPRS